MKAVGGMAAVQSPFIVTMVDSWLVPSMVELDGSISDDVL